jgi:hypothetical protein
MELTKAELPPRFAVNWAGEDDEDDEEREEREERDERDEDMGGVLAMIGNDYEIMSS